MKKINLLIIFSSILLLASFIHAQEFDFAPLQLGNIWVYKHQSGLLIRGEVVDSSFVIDSINILDWQKGILGMTGQ